MLTTPATLPRSPDDPARSDGPVRLAAIGGDTLVLGTEGALRVRTGLIDGLFRDLPLSWAPGHLAVSPSGRFAAAVSATGNQGEVFDTASGRSVLVLGDPAARRHSLVLAIMAAPDGEVLLLSRQRSTLEVLTLPDGTTLSRAERIPPVPFVFGSLHPMLDGDTVVVIGHNESEGKDSLLTLSLKAMAAEGEAAEALGPISDYAYRIAAGPCGADAVAIYRDPEDDEVLDGGDDAPAGELTDFRGLYVRRLVDGALVERVVCDLPLESGAPMLGTGTTILAFIAGRLFSVPRGRASSAPSPASDGIAAAFDPAGGRAVSISASGAPRVFDCTDAVAPEGTA